MRFCLFAPICALVFILGMIAFVKFYAEPKLKEAGAENTPPHQIHEGSRR